MITVPYRQAFERIQSEYREMPGMRLTLQQVHRLCGVEPAVCELVLDALVRAKFLQVGPDGNYQRTGDGRSGVPATSLTPRLTSEPQAIHSRADARYTLLRQLPARSM